MGRTGKGEWEIGDYLGRREGEKLCICFYYSMYTREGFAFFPLPSTKIAPSPSHSPLPVLLFFELHGAIRHNGAVKLGSRIKKNQLLTTIIYPITNPAVVAERSTTLISKVQVGNTMA